VANCAKHNKPKTIMGIWFFQSEGRQNEMKERAKERATPIWTLYCSLPPNRRRAVPRPFVYEPHAPGGRVLIFCSLLVLLLSSSLAISQGPPRSRGFCCSSQRCSLRQHPLLCTSLVIPSAEVEDDEKRLTRSCHRPPPGRRRQR
jgi:hypothetical protein